MKTPIIIDNDDNNLPTTTDGWVEKIERKWSSSVASILDTAQWVLKAELNLAEPKQFAEYKEKLQARGISGPTLSKLKAIAESDNFKREHLKCLPPSYNYLYQLADLNPAQYGKVYMKLSQGADFLEASQVLRKKTKKKLLQQKVLFVLTAEPDKLNKNDLQTIQDFVDGFSRKSVIKVRKSPTYNKMFADDE